MHPSARRLILWDIDGTLTRSGSVAAEIFHHAAETLLGHAPPGTISFAGKTDRQIAEELLALAGSADADHPEAFLDFVESELDRRAREIAIGGSIHPGAREAIEAFARHPEIAQTVLTGNIAPNAKLKLAAFGLDELLDLDVGAYGREHADRRMLLPVALQLQRERRGRSFSPDETWIIGDTPNDLACARFGGAHCILVATGRFPVAELVGRGADAVFEDLSDTERVVATVIGGGPKIS